MDEHFNFDRKGVFKARTTTEKLIAWKKEAIRRPLLASERKPDAAAYRIHAKFATIAFKAILSYMGDRTTKRETSDHVSVITSLLMKGVERLSTEIFSQLIKQTTENPDEDSNDWGWQLILICISFASPSEELMPFLMSHCVKNLNTSPFIGGYAAKVMQQCIRSCKLVPRVEKIMKVEVYSAQVMEEVGVKVYYVDGRYSVMNVDSLTTVGELEVKIADMLGIKVILLIRHFVLFLFCEI